MKKWAALLMALALLVSLTGCAATEDGNGDLQVLTSFYPIYIFTLNVTDGIEGVTVQNMTEPQTGCLHDYTLLPKDVQAIETADVFIINGGGMEGYLADISEKLEGKTVIDTSQGLTVLDHNSHFWLNLEYAQKQVQTICDRLSAADPANQAAYKANAAAYIEDLAALDAEYKTALQSAAGESIVTFHEAFTYFADAYQLHIAAVMAYEPDEAPTGQEIVAAIEAVRANGVKALFTEPQYSTGLAETISAETGVPIYTLNPAVTGPYDKGAFTQMMEENLAVLQQVFSAQ